MRFSDLAIDLAAVLSASRSVASKHIALRGRQLDYYKTSRVATDLKKTASTVKAQAEEVIDSQINPQSPDPVIRPEPPAASAKQPSQSATAPRTASKPHPLDDRAGRVPTPPFSIPKNDQLSGQSFAAPVKEAEGDLDVPAGIDVNIFHTQRGSKVLGSLRKDGAAQRTPGAPPGGPAKEHPLRNWPNPPSPQPEQTPSTTKPLEPKAAQPSPATEPARPVEPRQTSPQPEVKSQNVDSDIAQVAKAISEEAAPSSTYQLRESKVPSSRFGRLWNYGGLAAGMLGGAVTESVSRAFGGSGSGSVMLSGANMERLVAKLSRMRGAALKIGQMLSFQDAKIMPAPIQEVLQRVQDRADYMPAWQRDRVLANNLGAEWRDLFEEFEEKPIAAASIGQVHKARLKSNSRPVAVKIQFPGVADSINSDLDNLSILLTATKLLPRGLYLNKTIDNARLELGWECDYEREAICAKRYKELLEEEGDVFEAPHVYLEACGKQVLTMDFMNGIGVTRVKSFTQEQRDWIGTQILRLCLREITEFRFMQTDPNWTNFLYNADTKKLELLDFGASREYPEEFVSQYVQLLAAASRSDKETVKQLSESLGYLTGHESKIMVDAHIQSVLTLAEPFLASAPEVYDFHDQTITERVKALIPVMLHERLAPPPEETYSLHRKLSGAFLLCAKLGSKVRCREMFDKAVAKSGFVDKA
ncbi:hypothetical protein K4F52_003241 [Lecanicillium sp. MT-2017a]|nr:hypothetical protein K4F52_003241 [Lecanicillium sp. MT-2017a]